ncbi:MAG TPA: restriction endonuclease subunit S [Anaerolineales bacterium]|nr:restriction endonuclease subunit S [Anaerolineales bacterium]
MHHLITDNLDIWTTAQQPKKAGGRGRSSASSKSLHGIQKLRELILELAVRGKLVPQEPNDEPANELLKRIATEKNRLIKEGKIKKQKSLPPIGEDEKPFELRRGWEWARLGNVTSYGMFDKAELKDVDEDTWVLELEDVEKSSSKLLNKVRRSERAFRSSKNRFSINDVIYGKLRPYLDKVIIADEDGVCTTEMIPLRGYANITPHYLRLVMKSPYFIKYANESTHGMNLPRMGTDKARLALFPMVSESEQYRIVARVDELMTLCDKLEQEQAESGEAHQQLVETLLGTLTQAEDNAELEAAWQRMAEHFDTLFTTEASIDQLKQTILQLAVMGKLVPQDPTDEPASELLKKITTEKERLIKEKKIKKQKPLPAISEEEIPFELPHGWECSRLADLLPKFQNGASSRGDKEGKETVVLRLADIKNWKISLDDTRSLVMHENSISRYKVEKNDVLIIRVNGSADIVGRFIFCDRDIDAIYCDHFIRMRFPVLVFSTQYLSLLAASDLIRRRIEDMFISTAGQKTVNQKHIGSLVVTIPPIDEQYRIVAKVDELMVICDNLKEHFQEAQVTQVQLAEAIVEQAVN